MTFSNHHEALRKITLDRIKRGSLTAAKLARQAGLSHPHISNFLNQKRKLSLEALDKVLGAESLTTHDLDEYDEIVLGGTGRQSTVTIYASVPLVAQSAAIVSARIRPGLILDVVKVRSEMLNHLRDKCSAARRRWDRFVAVRITDDEAELMHPVLPARSIVFIDRQYISTVKYESDRPTVYAVRSSSGKSLRFRYVARAGKQLVLSAHSPAHTPELLELSDELGSADWLVGRAFLVISEL